MKITIIGGGIAGLTNALALNKLGFSQVFERAEQLNEVGAGIWMQPNALKVLDWLGPRRLRPRKWYAVRPGRYHKRTINSVQKNYTRSRSRRTRQQNCCYTQSNSTKNIVRSVT
jgi:2-polyprenyl-6-methoxyphenol hydroxylase-like FAD-dependent oxidoreductase